jgi:uncharacterized SAM-binding protein YcdF (DUF218 family)
MSEVVDAAVILGCRVERDGSLSAALERRARRALEELTAGRANAIVAAGGRAWGDWVEAEAIADWLVERGVAPERVLLERLSLTTVENALFVSRLASERGLRTLSVVTCDWHLPRALASFRAVGLACRACPAPTPAVAPVDRRRRALREWLSGALDARVVARAGRLGSAHPFPRADAHARGAR